MAQADKTLSKFQITKEGEGFTLHIEDDAGETITFGATAEQLDVVSEHMIEMLEEDDAS